MTTAYTSFILGIADSCLDSKTPPSEYRLRTDQVAECIEHHREEIEEALVEASTELLTQIQQVLKDVPDQGIAKGTIGFLLANKLEGFARRAILEDLETEIAILRDAYKYGTHQFDDAYSALVAESL